MYMVDLEPPFPKLFPSTILTREQLVAANRFVSLLFDVANGLPISERV